MHTTYVAFDDYQEIVATGTDPEGLARLEGVVGVLTATEELYTAATAGEDVSWLTVEVEGMEVACLDHE